jgi:acylphosphatase
VELTAEGEDVVLQALLDQLKTGPSLSQVDHVDYQFLEPLGEFRNFSVRFD